MTHTNRTKGLVRMALMGAAFVVLTIVLIVFQPGSPRHASNDALPDTSVTRVAPALENVAATSEDQPAVNALAERAPAPTFGAQSAATAQPTQTNAPTSMRDMTFGAISNLKSVTTGEAPAPGEPGSLLHSVVQRSIGAKPVQTEVEVAPEITAVTPVRRPKPSSYFVRSGDTLVSIARDVYGDANMASELFLLNKDIISRPDSLSVGMVLALP